MALSFTILQGRPKCIRSVSRSCSEVVVRHPRERRHPPPSPPKAPRKLHWLDSNHRASPPITTFGEYDDRHCIRTIKLASKENILSVQSLSYPNYRSDQFGCNIFGWSTYLKKHWKRGKPPDVPCRNPGLNQGPYDLQSHALPTELFRPPAETGGW